MNDSQLPEGIPLSHHDAPAEQTYLRSGEEDTIEVVPVEASAPRQPEESVVGVPIEPTVTVPTLVVPPQPEPVKEEKYRCKNCRTIVDASGVVKNPIDYKMNPDKSLSHHPSRYSVFCKQCGMMIGIISADLPGGMSLANTPSGI
jgi:hypothetical protein